MAQLTWDALIVLIRQLTWRFGDPTPDGSSSRTLGSTASKEELMTILNDRWTIFLGRQCRGMRGGMAITVGGRRDQELGVALRMA